MRKIFLLLSICFAYVFSFSQKNYQPATIVTINGESLPGEIAYKNWKENPSTVLFRKDKSSEPKNYGVEDLESFSVSGDVYKRAIVDIVERKDNLSHLSKGEWMPTRTDTVFLLTVVSGPRSLYYYTDNVNHFYITNGTGYEWLKFNKYKLESEVLVSSEYYSPTNQKYVATNKEYISQLKEYLKDCSSIKDDINYDLKSLRKAFISYYKCLGTDPVYVQKAENEKIEIGVIAGASSTTFNVNTSRNDIIGRIGFSPSMNFAAGAFFDLVFPRERGRISFNNEVMYSAFKTEGEYRSVTSPSTYDDYAYNFEYSYLKLNTMLRYKFFTNNYIFFVNGGMSNGMVLSEVNRLTKVHTFNGANVTYTSKGFNDTRKHELGFLIGGGLRKNRASVELRAEKGNGPFRSSGYKASVIRYFAMISYRIR